MDECIGAVEAAHMLGKVPTTLCNWHKLGIGPTRHYFDRKPYYIRAEVEQYRDAHG